MKNNMLSSALGLISGPLKNILDQLAGEKNELWLEILNLMSRMTPESILKALKGIKPWMKISVGGETLTDLIKKLQTTTFRVGIEEKVGIRMEGMAHYIMNKQGYQSLIELEKDVEFVKGSLENLFGFNAVTDIGTFLDEVFLVRYGLELCKSGTDTLYLRLNYLDQPLGEQVSVGMIPLVGSDLDRYVFNLASHHPGGLTIDTKHARPGIRCSPNSIWVFRRVKKS